MPMHFLTDLEAAEMRELMAWWRRQRRGTANRPRVDQEEHQAPEVYVVRVGDSGIPALDAGSETGTGMLADDAPGSADCDVYRIVESDDTGTGPPWVLERVGELEKRVFNVAGGAQPAGWSLAVRDKFGSWLALPTGAAAQEGFFVPSSSAEAFFVGSHVFNGGIYVWDSDDAGTITQRLLYGDVYCYSVNGVDLLAGSRYGPAVYTGRSVTDVFGAHRFYNVNADAPLETMCVEVLQSLNSIECDGSGQVAADVTPINIRVLQTPGCPGT